MTWAPCQRIVRADVPPAFKVRGITAPIWLCWPDAFMNGGADYSIDFSHLMCRDSKIVQAEITLSGGEVAWTSIFGTLATAWISWFSPGLQQAKATVRTSAGDILNALVSINVRCESLLISVSPPAIPPNAITLGGVPFLDASGSPIVTG